MYIWGPKWNHTYSDAEYSISIGTEILGTTWILGTTTLFRDVIYTLWTGYKSQNRAPWIAWDILYCSVEFRAGHPWI
jgi:hypothetical protein